MKFDTSLINAKVIDYLNGRVEFTGTLKAARGWKRAHYNRFSKVYIQIDIVI